MIAIIGAIVAGGISLIKTAVNIKHCAQSLSSLNQMKNESTTRSIGTSNLNRRHINSYPINSRRTMNNPMVVVNPPIHVIPTPTYQMSTPVASQPAPAPIQEYQAPVVHDATSRRYVTTQNYQPRQEYPYGETATPVASQPAPAPIQEYQAPNNPSIQVNGQQYREPVPKPIIPTIPNGPIPYIPNSRRNIGSTTVSSCIGTSMRPQLPYIDPSSRRYINAPPISRSSYNSPHWNPSSVQQMNIHQRENQIYPNNMMFQQNNDDTYIGTNMCHRHRSSKPMFNWDVINTIGFGPCYDGLSTSA